MLTYHLDDSFRFSRKTELVILAFFSFSGSLFGVLISYTSDSFLPHLMHRTIASPVTIVGLVSVTFFPFLITAIATFLSKTYLFFLLAFFKCFSFAFVRSCVYISFPQAGWLVGTLLLLSDSIVVMLLHWFWIRHLHSIRDTAIKDMIFCLAVTFAMCIIDYRWVLPFLMNL